MATTYFATEAMLRQRASVGAILAASDDDADGVENSVETDAAITECRNYSRARISSELLRAGFPQPFTQDENHLNEFLAYLAVDIEFHRLASRRGHGVTQSQQDAFEQAISDLKDIGAKRLRVPGLAYPGDGQIETRAMIGRPVASNPHRRR